MKKVFKVLLIVFIVLYALFVSLLVYFYLNYEKEFIDQESQVELLTYRNEELGFEIMYPDKLYQNYASYIEYVEGYDPVGGLVPVKILTDKDTAYFKPQYFIECEDLDITYNPSIYKKCERIETTIDNLRKPISWSIEFKNIQNNEELSDFIKERYGSTCSHFELELYLQDGVYKLSEISNGTQEYDENCFVNYATILLYYPEKNRVAVWDIGMEYSFWGDENGDIQYDPLMINSFRFID